MVETFQARLAARPVERIAPQSNVRCNRDIMPPCYLAVCLLNRSIGPSWQADNSRRADRERPRRRHFGFMARPVPRTTI